jgi:hypothetical protein
LTLALSQTEGSFLGNVGEGWAEPQNVSDDERLPCVEPNVLIQLELVEWPQSDDAVQEIAFAVGGRIEDAWGSRGRRFLALRGTDEGRFDVAHLNG